MFISMSIIKPSIFALLNEQIQSHSRSWLESGALLIAPPEQIVRKFSLMLRYPVKIFDIERKAVLVKIARYQGMEFEDAITDKVLVTGTIREYEMLRSIERIFSQDMPEPIFCYIRPLAVLEEWNALVTEELDCIPLKNYLFNIPRFLGNPKNWETLEMLLGRSARWLHVYHHGMGDQGFDTLQNIGVRDQLEESLAEMVSVLREQDAVQIQKMVDAIIDDLPTLPVPMAVLHGDFHCSNLLVTPGLHVGALDADAGRGPIYEDIAKLIADLETRSLQVFTFGRFISPRRMERLRSAVLKGYFGDTDADSYLLELFLSLAILVKWKIDEELLTNSSGFQRIIRKLLSPIRRYYMLRILTKHLENVILQNESLQITKNKVAA